jgi:ribonuclease E
MSIPHLRAQQKTPGKICMSKKMLVNATHPEENRVAIVVDGILTELDVEVSGREPTKGNIYKAVVVRVEPGLQAAFVDYGAERLGFLQIDEVNAATVKPDFKQGGGAGRPRINDLLHRSQEILVQITKEERGTKGAALTTYLSLAGRFMVCMPGSQTRGVSRKVESDAERKQLKKAMASLDLPDDIGYIVRTAGLGKTQEELQRDFNYLVRLYEGIRELGKIAKAPSLIYKESNLVIRSIRDYFTTEMDEVLIDDPDVFKEAREFFQRVMPEHAGLVKLHQERRPIFSRYQIEDQIETINQNKVQLPSGGSIVIDTTEALVAIDVNSGKMTSEQGVESTAYKTNLEAAEEIGRQLRLRDLGGLIVVDFIDMRDRKHIRDVENTLKKSLENDKARVSIGRISSKFGLLEMSRQRIKTALTEGTLLSCPHCQGSGRIKSSESLAVGLMRRIHAGVAKGQVGKVEAQLPLNVASYLLNNKREELYEMERRHSLRIHIHGRPDFLTDQIEIEFLKREKEKPAQTEYVEAGNLPPETAPEAAPEAELETVFETEEQKEDQEPNVENPEKTKKRRRRRRRKPASEKADAEAVQADSGHQTYAPAPEEGAQPPVIFAEADQDQPVVTASNVESAEVPAAITETKPKRKRAPRKKTSPKPIAAAQTGAADSAVPANPKTEVGVRSDDLPPTATVESPATAGHAAAVQEPAAKPKRRSRPPRKKPTVRAVDAATNSETTAAIQETGPVQPQTDESPAAANEAKPQHHRTPQEKPVEGSPRIPSEGVVATPPLAEPANPPPQGELPAADLEARPKPRRPARRRSPANKSAPEEPGLEGTPAITEAEKPAQPAALKDDDKKPKRRRPPRKKTSNKPIATEQSQTEGS